MNHYDTTIGFEGGSSETRLPPEISDVDCSAKACYELVVAHVVIAVEREMKDGRMVASKGGEWFIGGFNLTSLMKNSKTPALANGPFGNIVKECICLTYGEWFMIPNGDNGWKSNEFMLEKLFEGMDAKTKKMFMELLKKMGDENPLGDIANKASAHFLDHYLHFSLTHICGKTGSVITYASGCKEPNCKCNDRKSRTIDNVNHKTKKYTLADGTEITLEKPGNANSVVEQIVKAELAAVQIDCIKGSGSDV